MTTSKFTVIKSDDQWKSELDSFSYLVLRKKATEPPFSSELNENFDEGLYLCNGCGSELFESQTKFDSGCGWPSFYQPIKKENVQEVLDLSHGMVRREVVCSSCGGHLGHVFDDGYNQPTGLRYCMNGVSLKFKKL